MNDFGVEPFYPAQEYFYFEAENPNSLSDNDVRAMHADSSGVLWMLTRNGGLNRFDVRIADIELFSGGKSSDFFTRL